MRPGVAAFWVALAAAVSPLLVDLVRHWIEAPWSRYSLVFPVLLVARIRVESPRPAPARDGLVWVAAALALELAAAAGGVMRLGRVALPVAVWGGCRLFGLARPATAALALFAVPLPHGLNELAGLDGPFARGAALAVGWLGASPQVLDPLAVVVGGQALALSPADGGLNLVALLAGLGWHAGLVLRERAGACARRALVWGALGLPLQAAAMTGAVAITALSGASAGRALLSHAVWPALAFAGLVRTRALARHAAVAP